MTPALVLKNNVQLPTVRFALHQKEPPNIIIVPLAAQQRLNIFTMTTLHFFS